MAVTEAQIKAILKLQSLAEEKLKDTTYSFHDNDRMMLASVPSHVRNILESHENPYCWSSVEGSLETLRHVAKHFKFDLKGE